MVKSPPEPLYIFQDFVDGATSLAFETINGKIYLLVGSGNGVCKIFNLQTMKSDLELNCGSEISGNSILKCGKYSNGIWVHVRMIDIQFWSIDANFKAIKQFSILSDFAGFCGSLVCTVDGQELVVLPRDKQVDIYSMRENGYQLSRTISFEQFTKLGMPMCMKMDATSPSDNRLLIGFENGEIHAWNLNNSLYISSIKLHDEAVICMDVTDDLGISGSVDNKIKFFKFDISHEHQTLFECKQFLTVPHDGVSSVSVRNDRKIFACGCWDGKIRVYSVKSSKPLAVLNLHTDSIQCVIFDETNPINLKRKYLAAGSKDGTVSLWSIYEEV